MTSLLTPPVKIRDFSPHFQELKAITQMGCRQNRKDTHTHTHMGTHTHRHTWAHTYFMVLPIGPWISSHSHFAFYCLPLRKQLLEGDAKREQRELPSGKYTGLKARRSGPDLGSYLFCVALDKSLQLGPQFPLPVLT